MFDPIAQAALLGLDDSVRVINGPFADQIGRFCTVDNHVRIFIPLELLGREVRTSMSAEAIVPA